MVTGCTAKSLHITVNQLQTIEKSKTNTRILLDRVPTPPEKSWIFSWKLKDLESSSSDHSLLQDTISDNILGIPKVRGRSYAWINHDTSEGKTLYDINVGER